MTLYYADPEVEANVPLKSDTVDDEEVPVHALLPDVTTDIANTAARLSTIVTSLSAISGFVDGLEALAGTLNTLQTTIAGYVDGLEGLLGATLSTQVPDVTASGTLTVVGSEVVVAVTSRPYVGAQLGAGFTTTLAADASYDGGTTWPHTCMWLVLAGGSALTTASSVAASGTALTRSILVPPGATHVKVRAAVTASGSATLTLRASTTGVVTQWGATVKTGAQCVTLATDDPSLTYLSPAGTIYDGSKNVTTAGTRVVLAASQALTKGVRVRAKDANTGLIYIGGTAVSSSSDRLAPGESTWIDANNLAIIWLDAAVSGEGVTFSAW